MDMTMKTVQEFLGPEPMTGIDGERGRHWIRYEDGDRLWLVLDRQEVSTNTFNEEVFRVTDLSDRDIAGIGGGWDLNLPDGENTIRYQATDKDGEAA